MWFKKLSNDSDVVISTRVRYGRNISGYKFVHMLDEEKLNNVIDIVGNAIDKKEYQLLKMKDIDEINRGSLVEQHFISKEFEKNKYGAIITNKDSTIVAMVNEEDMLRIQSFESGFNIDSAYNRLKEFTDELSEKIKFAKNDKYGYITSCPTNVGSAMRVSVMLHLPGLAGIGLLNKLIDQAISIGISVRGYYGENTNSSGYIYQISNQKTLGLSDEEIITNVKLVVTSIIEQERKAREMLKNTSIYLEDSIYRAYGILKYSRNISEEEAVKLLSQARLGCANGILTETTLEKIQELMVNIRVNSLKLILKEDFSKDKEDIKRAEYIRREL